MGALSAKDLPRFEAALEHLPPQQGRLERWMRRLFGAFCWLVGWTIQVELMAPLPRADGRAGADGHVGASGRAGADGPASGRGRAGAGCIVVAAPHRAWVEPFLLLAAWPPEAARLVWLADARTVTRSWWRRRLLPRVGVLPVTPGSGSPRRYAQAAAAATRAGHAIAVFPEVGPPSTPDRTRRISPGFAYLALCAGAPIIPVVIGGTHHIVRGSGFSLRIGPAVEAGAAMADPFGPAGREGAAELTARVVQAFEADLPARNAWADARRPERDRWRWLATLLG